ncbi:MAG TPA: hypothetical protein VF784_17785 [Anaerolineales bacterium]
MRKYSEFLPIALLLTAALLVGALIVKDYGQSWDEPDIYRYADYALGAYRYFFHTARLSPFSSNLNLYGPAYFMAADLGARLIIRLVPQWSQVDAWHFIYFLTFLACVLCIYLLSRRWATPAAALGAAILFLTQPLLWGHAFINPKDIPFMTLFAASILAGLVMIDRYKARRRLELAMVPASILFGITCTLRVIGPWAGIIVLGYAVYKLRGGVVALAAAYLVLATITAYVAWPYLWTSPISHLIESVQTMSAFPFPAAVLFEGQLYKPGSLPRSYFPVLLAVQLSESALLLIGAGIAASIVPLFKRRHWQSLGLFLAWFLIPALVVIGLGSPLYDNARQLYFLLPPLFILAGIALDRLFAYLTHPVMQAAAMLLAALPGVLIGARLHPYEYVYYNALVGGTGGAYREFEMDYWGISFKELSEYMNATAPPDARVLVFGPDRTVARYARPDIQVFVPGEASNATYEYVLLLTRKDLDERRCTKAKTVDAVGRRGAVFSVMKSIPSGVPCP